MVRMFDMMKIIIWKEPSLFTVGTNFVLHEKGRGVMQHGDVCDKRVLGTIHVRQVSQLELIDSYFRIYRYEVEQSERKTRL